MEFYAHSLKAADKSQWQLLCAHLQQTAELAGKSGDKIGLGAITRLTGLLHDLGKYNPDFQKKLNGENISVSHSAAGAKIIADMAEIAGPQQKLCAEIIKYCILGHHAGLPDYDSAGGSVEQRLRKFDKTEGGKGSVLQPQIVHFRPEACRSMVKLRQFGHKAAA